MRCERDTNFERGGLLAVDSYSQGGFDMKKVWTIGIAAILATAIGIFLGKKRGRGRR